MGEFWSVLFFVFIVMVGFWLMFFFNILDFIRYAKS